MGKFDRAKAGPVIVEFTIREQQDDPVHVVPGLDHIPDPGDEYVLDDVTYVVDRLSWRHVSTAGGGRFTVQQFVQVALRLPTKTTV